MLLDYGVEEVDTKVSLSDSGRVRYSVEFYKEMDENELEEKVEEMFAELKDCPKPRYVKWKVKLRTKVQCSCIIKDNTIKSKRNKIRNL